jgi:hypothetical protein
MNFIEELEHPARYYVYYLFSQRRYRTHEIIAMLRRQNMPVPAEEAKYAIFEDTLKRLQSALVFPPNFDPTRYNAHAPTAEWLRKYRIYDMWAREPNVTYAFDILDIPSVRRSLEIMLLGPLSLPDIARRLSAVHGIDPSILNVGTVRYYAHYFWNMECVPLPKQPEILRQMQGVDNEDYFAAYNSPRSQVGASMSLYIATRGGSGVPKEAEMFKYMRDCSFMEFIKTVATRYPGMNKATAMQALLSSVIAAQEQVDMRRGGSAELMDHLRRLETRYDERSLTTAADLPLHTLAEDNKREMEESS